MKYDIALKVIFSRCLPAVLEAWCGLSVERSDILDARPQETASLRRSDIAARLELKSGEEVLVVIELASRWEKNLPLRLLEYRTRHKISEDLDVLSFVFLLRPSSIAVSHYRDREVDYRFRLVRLYELDARKVIEEGNECLLAFVPVMKNGESLMDEAEKRIYEGNIDRLHKADLLTGMAILSGLVSPELPARLLARRRDIMIESAAYELIKKEGIEEGIKLGIQQGIQQGIKQGSILEAQEMVIEALEERFGIVPESVVKEIKEIETKEVLRHLFKLALRAKDMAEFKQYLKQIKE